MIEASPISDHSRRLADKSETEPTNLRTCEPANLPPGYAQLLEAKKKLEQEHGVHCEPEDVNPICLGHQVDPIVWAVKQGNVLIGKSFGLGKSIDQIEINRLTLEKTNPEGRALIVTYQEIIPEFLQDALKLTNGVDSFITEERQLKLLKWQDQGPNRVPHLRRARTTKDLDHPGLYITHYEAIREGNLDPTKCDCITLDEGDILRGCFEGSKTYGMFKDLFEGSPITRRIATATPCPNEYMEILAYSQWLGVMEIGEARTRFFQRNSTKAHDLTLLPHMAEEFWLWVSTWAAFILKPSDLGHDDTGYELPKLDIRWHILPSDHQDAGEDKHGQKKLIKSQALSAPEAAKEKKQTIDIRMAKLMELRAENPEAHRVIWHALEDERRAIEKQIPGIATIYGKADVEDRAKTSLAFGNGEIPELATKPELSGSGCNYQRFCNWAIFLSPTFKFREFIQAVHRIYRFLQTKDCRIDIIITETEEPIKLKIEKSWREHDELMAQMTAIIREYGLGHEGKAESLKTQTGIARRVHEGKSHYLANDDSILYTREMEENSVGAIVTSPPFSNQYRYSAVYNDLGHNPSLEAFFEQLDYLTPECFRVLMPGRIMAVHVKDRIEHGNMNDLGFPTVSPFHAYYILHAMKHGFKYMGAITINTDVVRENNQTYRLSWTEMCKDGTKMSVGMPEYVLLFRKPQSDASRGYADIPVPHSKPNGADIECGALSSRAKPRDLGVGTTEPQTWQLAPASRSEQSSATSQRDDNITAKGFNPGTETPPSPRPEGAQYSIARWQIDAAAAWLDSGDRLISAEEIAGLSVKAAYRLWKKFNLDPRAIYNYEEHVEFAELLDEPGINGHSRLRKDFCTVPVHTDPNSFTWTDVFRAGTLNSLQVHHSREKHVCPLQYTTVDRLIERYTNPGEEVYDPFSGIGTVPVRAILKGRFGRGCELKPEYHDDAARYATGAENKQPTPTLFDLLDAEALAIQEEEIPA